MTTSNQQIDLPKIPSLPPIEMPDTSSFLEASDFVDDRAKLSPLNPSSISLVSQDTFMTADSSIFSDLNATPTTNSPELLSPASPLSLAPPTSLRKSISVDSFIKYRPASDAVTRPARGNTVSSTSKPHSASALHSSHPSVDSRTEAETAASTAWREQQKRPLQQKAGPSRVREASVSSTTGDELDDSFFDESDMERSEDLTTAARRGKTSLRRKLIPGDLSLPSRLQSVSSSPTMGKPPQPIVPERRSSLSHKLTKQRSLISVNTQLPSSPNQLSDITIAVLGAAGSGKSTVIRKGLKSYGLQEADRSSPTPGVKDESFRYVYRVGRISHNQATDCLLRVLEVDILSLDLTSDGSQGIFPEGAPPIHGLVFCYDASDQASYKHVEQVLQLVSHLKLPTIVFACKSDLERQVDRDRVSSFLERQHDIGLVEVTTTNPSGKEKIRTAFEFVFKAIFSHRLSGGRDRDGYRNPASPAVLTSPAPWDISRASSATPTASSSVTTHSPLLPPNRVRSSRLTSASDDSTRTRTPISPTRTRSMSDLLVERERDWDSNAVLDKGGDRSRGSSHTALSTTADVTGSFDETQEPNHSAASRESRPPRWLTLDELLDKLLFVSVSEDDPTFISHFLLTYRRFAIPRSILLAMQKRMRALDQSQGDPMFACYAQMKICWLLDHWIQLYPGDFAVAGTAGALSALVKSIIGKTYLLHYGSVFIPFMETVSDQVDLDSSWAMKFEEPKDDSDDSSSVTEATDTPSSPISSHTSHSLSEASTQLPSTTPPSAPAASSSTSNITRERKASLPLSAKVLALGNSPIQSSNSVELTWPKKLKQLLEASHALLRTDPTTLAQEISRLECRFFLQIKPRHWLQHVIGRGKKDPETDPIAMYNQVSNHIADWVVSLILCHDKPKHRARAILVFVELASRLRNMNNYSALRAVVAGINAAAFETDASMQIFKTKHAAQFKLFQSFDHLLQAVRAHGKYRMALRNSKGACIPALAIHLSDLIRAHEGNTDFHDDDPNHIHWEKFNMMGRFIDGISQCQQACRESRTFEKFPEDRAARDLLIQSEHLLMDPTQQDERIQLDKLETVREDAYGEEFVRPVPHRHQSRDSPLHGKDAIKKIFFW